MTWAKGDKWRAGTLKEWGRGAYVFDSVMEIRETTEWCEFVF